MRVLASGILLLGLFFLFVGRQVIGVGTFAEVATWLGVATVVGAFGFRLYQRSKAHQAAQKVELWILLSYVGVGLSLLIYAFSTDWGLELLATDPEGTFAAGSKIAWPAVLIVSLLALLFMELAYSRMPIPEAVDARRVRGAAFDGLSIAFSLVFVVSLNFVACEDNHRHDLSYFKTTEPSTGSARLVESLEDPVEILLLFPSGNEVLNQVEPYFSRLAGGSEHLTVRVRDHALEPELTQKHQITENGRVVLLQGEGESQRAEHFTVGTDLTASRSNLRRLDGMFQRSFAKLTTHPRELHLTVGHDEHTRNAREGGDPSFRLRTLFDALERANITATNLGLAMGLPSVFLRALRRWPSWDHARRSFRKRPRHCSTTWLTVAESSCCSIRMPTMGSLHFSRVLAWALKKESCRARRATFLEREQ